MPALILASLTSHQKELIRASFDAVLPEAGSFTHTFYTKLLRTSPAIRALFKGDIHTQAKKLLHMLWGVIYGLEHLERLETLLVHYGELHKGYGVKPEYFEPFKISLLRTLEHHLHASQQFTPETKQAWIILLDGMMQIMERSLA